MSIIDDSKIRKVDPHSPDINIDQWLHLMPEPSDRADLEYSLLKKNIEKWGQKEPVEVYRGGVIDGRRRMMVQRDIGQRVLVTFLPDETFANDLEVEAYILHVQLDRRNVRDTAWKKMLAKVYEADRGGISRSEFVRQQAARRRVPKQVVERALTQGQDIARVAPDVVRKVEETCADPQRVISSLARIPQPEQRRVMQENDTQRAVLAKADDVARQQATQKAEAKRRESLVSSGLESSAASRAAPTCVPVRPAPLTPRQALIGQIRESLSRSVQLLGLFVAHESQPAAIQESLQLVKSALDKFAKATSEDTT